MWIFYTHAFNCVSVKLIYLSQRWSTRVRVSDWEFQNEFGLTALVKLATVANFTKEVYQSLVKPPLNFNGGFGKLELTSFLDHSRKMVWAVRMFPGR